MIKTLRRKFILISLCSVILVLGTIITVINTANFLSVSRGADEILSLLSEHGGIFPKPEKNPEQKEDTPQKLSAEAPFDTRYFTVTLKEDGTALSVNTGKIAAVSSQTASEYASSLASMNKTKGWHHNYKYLAKQSDDGIMYLFLDRGRELDSFYSFLFASLLVSFGGILVFFVLILIFSKIALKPVAESYEKQKRFITDANHEIKTPLTIIEANAEVLEMEQGESPWISSIKRQVERLASLTQKLTFLSKMDEESSELQLADFSLSDAVEETAEPFLAITQAQGKALTLDISRGISFHGEEFYIRQLVSLLLDNAVKYSDKDGRISLSLKLSGKNKILQIKNSVSDIQTGNLDFLFERFYRLDASRNSKTGGYGIGLSVAKAIVTAHKGKITAKSEDGKSVVFTVIL